MLGSLLNPKTAEVTHMHFEQYCVSGKAACTINETILAGGRIVTVGTTSARTLESAAYMDEASGKYLIACGSGSTDIFIYPGYKFRIVDALITNFHLPEVVEKYREYRATLAGIEEARNLCEVS